MDERHNTAPSGCFSVCDVEFALKTVAHCLGRCYFLCCCRTESTQPCTAYVFHASLLASQV